ncbi:MAG TPA: hypothetical protein VEG44_10130 [Candidatus Acidoferrales bacterium]|nr:hypothetical protein [Candidatus Acidoferrales bacterium]
MSTELVSDNMNIFQAFSEGMHNDYLEGFVTTRQAGQSSVQGACDHITV